MTFSEIIYDKSDRVATITFNRPSRMNAFTGTIVRELRHALIESDRDDEVGAVIVTGAGRAYSAGADMDGLSSITRTGGADSAESAESDDAPGFSYMLKLRKPIIGAFNGVCVGIGFTSSLYFDIRIAAQSARLGLIFVRRGMAIEHGSSWMLPRLIGLGKAVEMALTGRLISASEALDCGLVHYVVADDQVMPKARELAHDIAHNCTPLGVAEAKRHIYEHLFTDLPTAIRHDDTLMKRMWRTEDFKEGIKSFLEKRPPRFTGR